MQVSVETTEGLGRRMRVQVPAERVDQEVERRLKDMSGRVKMDGFRPGKVPMKIVRKQYGAQVRNEVLSEVVQQTYSEALEQEALRPAGNPHIEPTCTEEGKDLAFEATFDLLPEIEVQGIDQIRVERPQVEITDADVDNVLERLRKQHADYEAVDRAAQEEDRVVIDFHGTIDGEAFSGNAAEDAPVVLGAGQLPEAFEHALRGAQAGQELTVEHAFPEQADSDLAGRTAVFQVTVKRVEAPQVPELDEAFAAQLGIQDGGVEALRQAVRQNMESERDQAVRQRLKRQVLDQLAELNDLELPGSLIDGEVQALQEQQGQAGELPEADRSAYEEAARRRVKLGLLVNELVRSQGIELDRERMMQQLREMAANSGQDPSEALQQLAQDRETMQSLEASVIEEQVVDWLLEQAQTEDKPMSFDELMNSDAQSSASA